MRAKIAARDSTDAIIEETLSNPQSIAHGNKRRLIAQRERTKSNFGVLLVRVIYEKRDNVMVVVSAYWSRANRYKELSKKE